MIVTCDGNVSGTVVRALSKRTPARASASMAGVKPAADPIGAERVDGDEDDVGRVGRVVRARRGNWPERPAPRREE